MEKVTQDTVLNESTARAMITNDSFQSHLDPLGIRHFVTPVLMSSPFKKGFEGCEETGEYGTDVFMVEEWVHENFSGAQQLVFQKRFRMVRDFKQKK